MKSEDYYYNIWYKERMELIKITKESNKLLDEIVDLKKKLAEMTLAEVLRNKVK